MNWLPPPTDFRQNLKAALAATDPAQRAEALQALAQCRLGFLETIQIDNAAKSPLQHNPPGFERLRLAILSHATVDHLLPPIRVAGLRRRLAVEIYTGSFGQYRQELFDPGSGLHAFAPQILLLSRGCRETLAGVPLTASAGDVDSAVRRTIDDVRSLWRKAREDLGAGIVQQSFLDTSEPLFGNYDRQVPGAPSRIVARLNDALASAAAEDNVMLLDVAQFSARDGIDAWFDKARWLQGKIEIAPQSAPYYGELLARVVGAQRGLSKKCLVLDLDNTLWGGVIGDVGVENIVLGEGSGAGEAHLALQQYAKSLQERGVILAVCSKNEASIAEAAFRDHPEMFLKREDITVFMANWTDKAENLKRIAEQLNIGIDSLVFVDDNPAERARIREALPAVAVPELPDDPAHYVRCLADAGYFEAVAFTDEDRQRVEQYSANQERETLRGSAQSMDDFLRGLDMSLVYGPVTAVDLSRVAQLINKTNQFNTTTLRMSAEEVAALAADSRNAVLQFRLLDRFGDNGLVSVMILSPLDGDPHSMNVVNWVMSCRVFGRQLEDEAMNIAVETAKSKGIKALYADLIPTKKNAVILNLFGNLGFAPAGPSPAGADATRWRLDLSGYTVRSTHIKRQG